MTTEAELRAVLAEHAGAVPEVGAVHAGIRRGIRQRRQRRRTATGIGVLAVMAVPVLGLRLADGPVDDLRPTQVAASPGMLSPDPRLVRFCSIDPASLSATATVSTFSDYGYTPTDAEELARLWKSPCGASGATMFGGEELAYGHALPITPSGAYPSDGLAVQTLHDAGYTLDDDVALAKQWNIADLREAKVTAGRKLIAGQTLPIQPGSALGARRSTGGAGLSGTSGRDGPGGPGASPATPQPSTGSGRR